VHWLEDGHLRKTNPQYPFDFKWNLMKYKRGVVT
jgi:hypothetical protein